MIQPAPMAAISFVELAAICHVLEIKLDHSSGLRGWNFLALWNEKRELWSFQKIPTIVTFQITFCMLLACHTGSAMRVPVANTQLYKKDRASMTERQASTVFLDVLSLVCQRLYPLWTNLRGAMWILALESAAAPKTQRNLKQTRQEWQPESGVIPTKVGMQCFSLDANWILVWTSTRIADT